MICVVNCSPSFWGKEKNVVNIISFSTQLILQHIEIIGYVFFDFECSAP